MTVGKAAGESTPEAYPLRYVEDVDEPRTQPAVIFSARQTLMGMTTLVNPAFPGSLIKHGLSAVSI